MDSCLSTISSSSYKKYELDNKKIFLCQLQISSLCKMELSQKSKLDQEEDESGGSTDKSVEHHMGSVR
ncbi:hypothetical protein MTR_1g103720 [Medicago truncatula]|uniref:Uncharacterized protein n=1 Tax=Medicago truncatula TaxID=3880 RepID=A0A072VR54_MEDTR|nr:hypothetical protein MTR_1g103720 [Medicago truncatula]